jgi:dTDP-4-amino-4,6-dideoxygalactose transaminase
VGSSRVAATRTISLSSPWLGEREEELLVEVLRSGRLSLGPTIDRFEEEFAATVGAPYAAAVSSGTAGLHLLCIAAGVGPDDEVVTSPYSFVASANCAIYVGATPVFADVDRRTFNLDPRAVEAALTDRTRAVVAVDIYGYPCEFDELRALCSDRGIALIEDACEALGARYKGRAVGSQSVPAVFAFYPNKQMTTGEGGMVTTHSEDEWRLLRSLRNQGRADSGGWLEHARLGFNYRLDDVRAAIGIGQLEKLDEILALRASVAERYRALLGDVDGLELPCEDDDDHERSWFVYVVTLPVEVDREAVISRLDAHGIQTARYLPCIHLQPYMRQRFGFRAGLCPVAEELSSRTLALPFHARLGQDDQEYVAAALESALSS